MSPSAAEVASSSSKVKDSPGVTAQLCDWIHSLTLEDIPQDVRTRAKYLILDGLACALNGAHVPWSEEAGQAVLDFEEPGEHALFGWDNASDHIDLGHYGFS